MKKEIKKNEPVYQQAYEIIRNMIIDGSLPPGSKLTEEKLAAQLGISRTPIRESIRRLEQEGLVAGKTVVEPSEDNLKDSYGIRILLEGYSARCAALNFTEEQKQRLLSSTELGKSDKLEDIMEANTTFHDIIMEASGNRYMIDVIDHMRALILLCRSKVVHTSQCMADEHAAIYKAITDGNPDLAERLMREHLEHNLQICLLDADES